MCATKSSPYAARFYWFRLPWSSTKGRRAISGKPLLMTQVTMNRLLSLALAAVLLEKWLAGRTFPFVGRRERPS